MKMEKIKVDNPTDKPYLVTGHRLYIIGSQDGLFPMRGEHIPHEMWGVWMPPIKVLNGIWMKVDGRLVKEAVSYEQLPYGASFCFRREGEWELKRFLFVPQEEKGFVMETILTNSSSKRRRYEISLGVESNLMPVWLSERAGIRNGNDKARFEKEGRLIFTDEENSWTAVIGCTIESECVEGERVLAETQPDSKTCYREVISQIELQPGESRKTDYFFAFSEHSLQEAEKVLGELRDKKEDFLREKKEVYGRIAQTARLRWPGQPVFEEMYCWTKYINDWIIRKVDGIGIGAVAGYAEFPWWFGNDSNYIVPALLMQGEYEICKATLRLIRDKSLETNGNGRVVHEISTNGVVFYEGMTTETPQFADTVWMIYQWSGDRLFLEEMYDFCEMGMEWIDSMCEDGLPRGYGISEIADLDCFCCDTAVLAVRGYEILSRMSAVLGKREKEAVYAEKYRKTWEIFQKEFFLPAYGLYGDMVCDREEALERAERWKNTLCVIREDDVADGPVTERKGKEPGTVEEKRNLRQRIENMEQQAMQMAPGERRAFYLFGCGHTLIPVEFGYLQGREAEAVFLAQKAADERELVKVENMMPFGVGRKMIGLGRIKQMQELVRCFESVAEGFSQVMPGATSEIYPAQGCFVQAWNSLATMWPYINSIFGVVPDAGRKKIVMNPCVGTEVQGMVLSNIPIGGEQFSFSYYNNGEEDIITVNRPSRDWVVELDAKAEKIRLVVEDQDHHGES